jgi:hypothetical protein
MHDATLMEEVKALDSAKAYVLYEILIVTASSIFNNLSESTLVHEL